MFCMISGGSGSGKSEFAEGIIEKMCEYHREQSGICQRKTSSEAPSIYIATMKATDTEAKEKIARHRNMRQHKGFLTKECFNGLRELSIPKDSIVLLDCLSNLVANEMFLKDQVKEQVWDEILQGIVKLQKESEHLVVVSNEIFSDGIEYDALTRKYIENLAVLHQAMAQRADAVIEVVCGIPIYHKLDTSDKEVCRLCGYNR